MEDGVGAGGVSPESRGRKGEPFGSLGYLQVDGRRAAAARRRRRRRRQPRWRRSGAVMATTRRKAAENVMPNISPSGSAGSREGRIRDEW